MEPLRENDEAERELEEELGPEWKRQIVRRSFGSKKAWLHAVKILENAGFQRSPNGMPNAGQYSTYSTGGFGVLVSVDDAHRIPDSLEEDAKKAANVSHLQQYSLTVKDLDELAQRVLEQCEEDDEGHLLWMGYVSPSGYSAVKTRRNGQNMTISIKRILYVHYQNRLGKGVTLADFRNLDMERKCSGGIEGRCVNPDHFKMRPTIVRRDRSVPVHYSHEDWNRDQRLTLYGRALARYGKKMRFNKFFEEIAEAQAAVCQMMSGRQKPEDVLLELADVLIVTEQLANAIASLPELDLARNAKLDKLAKQLAATNER